MVDYGFRLQDCVGNLSSVVRLLTAEWAEGIGRVPCCRFISRGGFVIAITIVFVPPDYDVQNILLLSFYRAPDPIRWLTACYPQIA